jgi:2-aminoadipate transaminase
VSSQPHSGGAQQPQEAQQSRGSRIDRYIGHDAARAQGIVASEIRALFAVAARPETVSLAGGMPFIAARPLDALGELAGQLVADRGAVALQYGSSGGRA